MRKLLKWVGGIIGGLVLIVLLAVSLFAAFNWTFVKNMRAVQGQSVTAVQVYQPQEIVKGSGAKPFPVADPQAPLLEPAAWQQMVSYHDSKKGLGLLVLHDGQLVAEHYRAPGGPAVQVQAQSMHKPVLALLIGAAVRDGIIASVDDPLGTYLTEWKDDPRGAVTLRSLLTMTSGFERLGGGSFTGLDLSLGDDVVGNVLGRQLDPSAKGVFKYDNLNSQLLGLALIRALEARGQGRYAAYLSRTLWQPIGAGDAALWLDRPGGTPRTYAFMMAPLRDWARVGELIRTQGKVGDTQVIPADWITQMIAPSPANPQFGFQLWRGANWTKERVYAPELPTKAIHSAPFKADDVIYFDGFGGQRVYVIPSARLVIARVTETDMSYDDAILVNLALDGRVLTAPPVAPRIAE